MTGKMAMVCTSESGVDSEGILYLLYMTFSIMEMLHLWEAWNGEAIPRLPSPLGTRRCCWRLPQSRGARRRILS